MHRAGFWKAGFGGLGHGPPLGHDSCLSFALQCRRSWDFLELFRACLTGAQRGKLRWRAYRRFHSPGRQQPRSKTKSLSSPNFGASWLALFKRTWPTLKQIPLENRRLVGFVSQFSDSITRYSSSGISGLIAGATTSSALLVSGVRRLVEPASIRRWRVRLASFCKLASSSNFQKQGLWRNSSWHFPFAAPAAVRASPPPYNGDARCWSRID